MLEFLDYSLCTAREAFASEGGANGDSNSAASRVGGMVTL